MEKPTLSLSELQDRIHITLEKELGEFFWITAEISELNTNYSGHYYLELVDKDSNDETIKARMRGIIWSKQARFLVPYFKTTAGLDLSEGISVHIKGKVEYHSVYGISFLISDIDPGFTVGELQRKKNEIINRLNSEGVLDMNSQLSLPLHPKRIAVISSSQAAGYTDFENQLINNNYNYRYELDLFAAAMQGRETSVSVLNAFEEISRNIDSFDIVVIVRGGGSATDLSWFDDYDIAFMISQFPLPVITGIGHEKDISATDIVANTSCKTPTAAAEFIISLTVETESYIESIGAKIVSSTMESIRDQSWRLENISNSLVNGSRMQLAKENQRLQIKKELIKTSSRYYLVNSASPIIKSGAQLKTLISSTISSKREKIEIIKQSLGHLNPEKILERGYSMVLKDGSIVKDSSQISKGDKITTILYKGSLDSEVFEIKE